MEKKILVVSASLGNFESRPKAHADQILPAGITGHSFRFDDSNYPLRINACHPRLQAKIPKMLAWEYFPGYDYYLWIDGLITLSDRSTLATIIDLMNSDELLVVRHPERSSIREEYLYMEGLMKQGSIYLLERYRNEPMRDQISSYLENRGFEDNKLYAGFYFCYSGKLPLSKPLFFRDWFYECARWSIQDQLSLPFLIWKHQIKVKEVDQSQVGHLFFSDASLRKNGM